MLTDAVFSYLAVRRAAGYALVNVEPMLLSFARYASEHGDDVVRVQTAISWACLGRSPERREALLRAVAGFARHARAEDPRHEVPPRHLLGRDYRRPTPFVFTPEQIRDLIAAARQLGPSGSLRPETYATLFSLLAATGLRVSEALALNHQDLTCDGLIVRKTKFQKSRLVPLHETVTTGLQRYLERRLAFGGDAVFIGTDGNRLKYAIVQWTFAKLVRSIGISPASGHPRPRIHCLRHTFAVRALESCPRGAHEVARHQVALLTYLGHCHIEGTYWYLQSTPHLLRDIAATCEAGTAGGDLCPPR